MLAGAFRKATENFMGLLAIIECLDAAAEFFAENPDLLDFDPGVPLQIVMAARWEDEPHDPLKWAFDDVSGKVVRTVGYNAVMFAKARSPLALPHAAAAARRRRRRATNLSHTVRPAAPRRCSSRARSTASPSPSRRSRAPTRRRPRGPSCSTTRRSPCCRST